MYKSLPDWKWKYNEVEDIKAYSGLYGIRAALALSENYFSNNLWVFVSKKVWLEHL